MAGFSINADLGTFLAERMTAITEHPVFLHVLSDTFQLPVADVEPNPLYWKHEYLVRKHVILVFQRRDAKNAVLVIGMSVHEYANRESRDFTCSYIQYIDTTGLFRPRPNQSKLTKSLISAYFAFARRCLGIRSIHLMASAKPSFLFAGSEFNPDKNRLSTAKLVKWWLAVIEETVTENARIKVWSPGEDLIDDPRTKNRIARRQTKAADHSVFWHYGPFYETTDMLYEVVPLFEDDPKWKHFESFWTDVNRDPAKLTQLKAKSFIETLALRPEFRNQSNSTLFNIEFVESKTPMKHEESQGKNAQLAAFATKMLSNLTFQDEQQAIESSLKITSWLKFMGSKPVDVSLQSVRECHGPCSLDGDEPKCAVSEQKTLKDSSSQLIGENQPMNVQALVKKRRLIQ